MIHLLVDKMGYGFEVKGDGQRRSTVAESRRCFIEDYGKRLPAKPYGDIPAQVVARLRARHARMK